MNVNFDDIRYEFQTSNFLYGLEQLKFAYEGACRTPKQDRKRLDDAWAKLQTEVAAGRATLIEEEPDGYVVDYGQDMDEAVDETEGALRYTREAFTIALHHLWERRLRRLMGKKDYDQAQAFAFLKNKGRTLDEDGLDTLRLVANVAKHDTGGSANKLFAKNPAFFGSGRGSAYVANYDDLRITDSDVEGFFHAAEMALR